MRSTDEAPQKPNLITAAGCNRAPQLIHTQEKTTRNRNWCKATIRYQAQRWRSSGCRKFLRCASSQPKSNASGEKVLSSLFPLEVVFGLHLIQVYPCHDLALGGSLLPCLWKGRKGADHRGMRNVKRLLGASMDPPPMLTAGHSCQLAAGIGPTKVPSCS